MADPFAIFSSTGGNIVTGLVYTLMGLAAICLLGLAYWFLKVGWKRYDITVRIYSKRKNGYKTWDDKGAYMKNKKTGEVYGFKLKHDKTLLQPPPFEMLMASAKGNTLHLLQLTSDEYFVLDPMIDLNETTDTVGTKNIRLKVIEGDIQLWATQMIDKIYSMYDRKGFWDKYGSYIVFAVVALMCIILIYMIVQKFDVLQATASSLDSAAQALKDLHSSGALVTTGA
jgi:hypothetical protein